MVEALTARKHLSVARLRYRNFSHLDGAVSRKKLRLHHFVHVL
jgi:hypothetical protein